MDQRLSAAERRKRIIEVSRELFARQSFHATTTRDIARAGGVSDALLYTYFTSKQKVLEAIIDDGMAQFASAGEFPSSYQSLPIAEYLRLMAQRFWGIVQGQRELFVILISDSKAVADDERFAHFIDTGASRFGTALEERARQGELRSGFNGYLVARQFIGAIVAFFVLQDLLGINRFHPLAPEEYLEQLVETILNGLRTSPSE